VKTANILSRKKRPEFYDYDLFIFQSDIKLHIATAGAIIPRKMILLTNNNSEIYDFYNNLDTEQEFQINPNLEEIVYNKELIKNERFTSEVYLNSFTKYAKKGFYSFDKTNIENPYDKKFHLVAYPQSNNKDDKFKTLGENLHFLNSSTETITSFINEIEKMSFQSFEITY